MQWSRTLIRAFRRRFPSSRSELKTGDEHIEGMENEDGSYNDISGELRDCNGNRQRDEMSSIFDDSDTGSGDGEGKIPQE